MLEWLKFSVFSGFRMSIKQFNGHYSPTEDRVVVRFNTADDHEYLLWFTRRVMLNAVTALENIATTQLATLPADTQTRTTQAAPAPAPSREVAEFRKEAIAMQTEFSAPYELGRHHPMGMNPVLVIGFRMTQGEKNDSLAFDLINKQTLTLNLPSATVYQFCLLLRKMSEQAGWLTAPAPLLPSSGKSMLETGLTEPASGGKKRLH